MTLFSLDLDTAGPLLQRVRKRGACRRDKTFFLRPPLDQKPVCRACPARTDCWTLGLNPEDYQP